YKSRLKSGAGINYHDRHLHVRELHSLVFTRYEPATYHGRLTLFRAENLDSGYTQEERLGWNGMATDGLDLVKFAGSHDNLFEEPNVRNVATELTRCIAEARSRTPD
ncbi:MAG: hypothetical protein QOD99_1156, partial [Chthoniobacter sp.]|nr:hypothetical protein [Chthoniobacter sp.]